MRSLSLLVVVLASSLAASPARGDDAKGPDPKAEARGSRISLRVVRIMPDTHQVLLFDKTRGTHVLAEVGGSVNGFHVDEILEDEVVLTANNTQYVLVAPDPAWRRRNRDDRTATRGAPADPYAASVTRPVDPYAEPAATGGGPVDPYADPTIRTVEAQPPNVPGDGNVRTIDAPAKAAPTAPAVTSPPAIPSASPTPPTVASATPTPPTSPPVASTTPTPPTSPPVASTTPTPAASPTVPASPKPTAPASTPAATAAPAPSTPPAAEVPAISSPASELAAAATGGRGAVTSPSELGGDSTLTRGDVRLALADFAKLTASVKGVFTPGGVRIDGLSAGSIFVKAGLRSGDLVTAVDGKPIRSLDDAADLYVRATSARNISVQLIRNGKPTTLRVTIQ
jgi:hypothetical protein